MYRIIFCQIAQPKMMFHGLYYIMPDFCLQSGKIFQNLCRFFFGSIRVQQIQKAPQPKQLERYEGSHVPFIQFCQAMIQVNEIFDSVVECALVGKCDMENTLSWPVLGLIQVNNHWYRKSQNIRIRLNGTGMKEAVFKDSQHYHFIIRTLCFQMKCMVCNGKEHICISALKIRHDRFLAGIENFAVQRIIAVKEPVDKINDGGVRQEKDAFKNSVIDLFWYKIFRFDKKTSFAFGWQCGIKISADLQKNIRKPATERYRNGY